MAFNRAMIREAGMVRPAQAGDTGANPVVTTIATAGNLTMTVAAVLGGVIVYTGAAGAVAYTLPTAADLIAALPDMIIGDSCSFKLCNTAAQVATITTATGFDSVDGLVTANAATRTIILTKTSATTMLAMCI